MPKIPKRALPPLSKPSKFCIHFSFYLIIKKEISYHIQRNWSLLWPSDPSSWLQIPRSGFDSRSYKIFLVVVGLERGPLSLVSKTEELLRTKSSGSGLEKREHGSRDPLRWTRDTLYSQKLTLSSLTRGGRSVGIVRSPTEATEFSLYEELCDMVSANCTYTAESLVFSHRLTSAIIDINLSLLIFVYTSIHGYGGIRS
jgi:hypothetical protein